METLMTEFPRSPLADDIEEVLFTAEQIAQRNAEIGAQISRDYADKDLILISILKGGVLFLADLTRQITIPHGIELVGASSYKGGVQASGGVRITKDVDQSLHNKDVLLIEDIYDTGNTLHVVYELLKIHRPASVEVCAMLRKNKPHFQKLDVKYVGFDIEDVFVVGYGLDYKEIYRNLPCIGVLKREKY
jgi:hypoxanthine phosphoribosyltransferase